MKSKKLNLLIIGTGMYVCGRSTKGYGTILPAVMQQYHEGIIDRVFVASKSAESFAIFDAKLDDLQGLMGINMPCVRYPRENCTDSNAYREAIADLPDPGAVIITTPDHLHTEMALAAIASGKHVLVVKPLSPTVADAQQMIQAAENAGVYGAVEFHKRWDLANLKLRQAIADQTIGDPLYFHVEFSQRKIIPSEIFSPWVADTNIFQYLGVHYADLIYFVTQALPCRMVATGQKKWLSQRGISGYDAIQVLIEWSKGFTSTILTNWIDPNCNGAMSQQKIEVIGTAGRFESDQTKRGVQTITDLGGIEDINPYFCQSYMNLDRKYTEYRGYGIESITQFLKDVASIAEGSSFPTDFEGRRPTFRDALVSTALVEGARLSLENDSQWVYFTENLQPYLK
jgi:predicted dehydrogenase